ncbi:hypothetical protein H1R20_g4765, partial [Candolleomyces eurysporus]
MKCMGFWELLGNAGTLQALRETVTIAKDLLSSTLPDSPPRIAMLGMLALAMIKCTVSPAQSLDHCLNDITSLLDEASSGQFNELTMVQCITELRTGVDKLRRAQLFASFAGKFSEGTHAEDPAAAKVAAEMALDGDPQLAFNEYLTLHKPGQLMLNRNWRDALMRNKRAIELLPKNHPLQASLSVRRPYLAIVSILSKEYSSGEVLDERIASLKEVIAAPLPALARELALVEGLLAIELAERFENSRNLIDIKEALYYQREWTSRTGYGGKGYGMKVILARILCQYGCEYDDLESLREARSILVACAAGIPPEDSDTQAIVSATLRKLAFHFLSLGKTDDIHDLLDPASKLQENLREDFNWFYQHIIDRRFPDNPDGDLSHMLSFAEETARSMSSQIGIQLECTALLAVTLLLQLKFRSDPSRMREGILLLRQCSAFVEDDNAPVHLCLGLGYQALHQIDGDSHHIQKALHHFSRAALHFRTPQDRLKAARIWLEAMNTQTKLRSQDVIGAAEIIVHSTTQLTGLEITVDKRHQRLKVWKVSKDILLASNAAIGLGEVEKALEWLERGRGLVWTQINSLRSPLDELRSHNPALASRLEAISRDLEIYGGRAHEFGRPSAIIEEQSSSQAMEIMHTKLVKQRQELIETIRTTVPGLENFLQPPPSGVRFKNLPASGPVVIVHAYSEFHAIFLIPGLDEPLHIPLPNFSVKRAEQLRDRLRSSLLESQLRQRGEMERAIRPACEKSLSEAFRGILRELWKGIVKPILDALAFPRSEAPSTRIWWCPTGPLTSLPLHAAGIYGGTTSESVFDYAVSSYIPTVSVLTDRARKTCPIPEDKAGMCLLSQANAHGLTKIPGTKEEINKIAEVVNSPSLRLQRLEDKEATCAEFLEAMESCSWIHLACHGTQDAEQPLKSGFALADGRLELAAIITKSNLKHAEFAFLSACETSTGDVELSEESAHLAAGMLAAGYRGVVGTMWSINDNHAPQFAEDFYRNLLAKGGEIEGGNKLNVEQTAYALHHAVQQLRKRTGDSEFHLWAPYVHFGL